MVDMAKKKTRAKAAAHSIRSKRAPATPPAARASSGAGAALSGFYNRIPAAPFLDRQTSAILYACILAYVLFVLCIMASPMKEEPRFTVSESPLYKNADLSLSAGENYTYVLEHGAQRQPLQFAVRRLWGCRGVVLYEGNDSQACLLQNGNSADDSEQRNSTIGNGTGLLFLPWMLAVSDDFSWSVSGDYWNGYISMRTRMNYTSLGKSSALGRGAYLVRVVSNAYQLPTDYYIDSEKRVLLYVRSGNTSAWLEEAPFALDASQIPND